MFHAKCSMQSVSCNVFHLICSTHCVPCNVFHAMCPIQYASCNVSYVKCSIQCVPCNLFHTMCSMQCVPCNLFHTMCSMQCVPCNVFHITCVHGLCSSDQPDRVPVWDKRTERRERNVLGPCSHVWCSGPQVQVSLSIHRAQELDLCQWYVTISTFRLSFYHSTSISSSSFITRPNILNEERINFSLCVCLIAPW